MAAVVAVSDASSPLTPAGVRFLDEHRVGHLATADAQGHPHLVPVVYVVFEGNIYIALDEKPKRVAPTQLRRVRNILVNPAVAFLVDDYSEDWSRLAYVLVHGSGALVQPDEADHARIVAELRQKYPQYRAMDLNHRPLIRIAPTSAVAWSATGSTSLT